MPSRVWLGCSRVRCASSGVPTVVLTLGALVISLANTTFPSGRHLGTVMSALRKLLFLAFSFVTATASAAQTTYSLWTPEPVPYEFHLAAPGPVTANTVFVPGDWASCSVIEAPCVSINFYVDAFAQGLMGQDRGWQAIGLETSQSEDYFYFEASAFTTSGVYAELGRSSTDYYLTVSVPEPATWLLFAGGMLLVGSRAWRACRKG